MTDSDYRAQAREQVANATWTFEEEHKEETALLDSDWSLILFQESDGWLWVLTHANFSNQIGWDIDKEVDEGEIFLTRDEALEAATERYAEMYADEMEAEDYLERQLEAMETERTENNAGT